MNKKGFTLTELIVCMAIFAVLSVVSYPAISNIVTKHKHEQYEEYAKLMVSAANIYMEKNDRSSVSLQVLIDEKLMEPLNVNGNRPISGSSQVEALTTSEPYSDKKILCPRLVLDNGECYTISEDCYNAIGGTADGKCEKMYYN